MKDFTRGPIARQIILFSLPIIAGNFFMQFYQIVDSAIVGQYLGKEALAAVGASMPVVFAIIALLLGVGSGASVVLSQYYGAKDMKNVRITADTIHIFLLVAGMAIAIMGQFMSELVFHAMSLPEELIPMAAQYLRIYLIGMVFMFGFNTISSILRGVGDSKTPLYFLAVTSVLNVVLDYLFIVGFGWGVGGAAWASVLAVAVSYIWIIIYLNHKKGFFRIDLFHLQFDRKIFNLCVRYGLPTGVQQSFVAIGGLALMSIISSFGTDVVAGYSAGIRVDGLALIPAMNFSMALTTFVGQNVGANRWDRVRKGLWLTMLFSSITCVILTMIIILFGQDILNIFTTDSRVIAIGDEYLVIVSSFFLLFSSMFIFNGMLRGVGAVMFPMISTILSLWIIRIPVAIWLSTAMGETGIWWAIPIGWGCGLLMSYLYYLSGKWKNLSIFAKQNMIPME